MPPVHIRSLTVAGTPASAAALPFWYASSAALACSMARSAVSVTTAFIFGVSGRAGEGGIERGLAWGFVAVTHQLEIDLRRHGGAAGVLHFVPHGQIVGTAAQGVGLDQLHAAQVGRLEAHA